MFGGPPGDRTRNLTNCSRLHGDVTLVVSFTLERASRSFTACPCLCQLGYQGLSALTRTRTWTRRTMHLSGSCIFILRSLNARPTLPERSSVRKKRTAPSGTGGGSERWKSGLVKPLPTERVRVTSPTPFRRTAIVTALRTTRLEYTRNGEGRRPKRRKWRRPPSPDLGGRSSTSLARGRRPSRRGR